MKNSKNEYSIIYAIAYFFFRKRTRRAISPNFGVIIFLIITVATLNV